MIIVLLLVQIFMLLLSKESVKNAMMIIVLIVNLIGVHVRYVLYLMFYSIIDVFINVPSKLTNQRQFAKDVLCIVLYVMKKDALNVGKINT